MSRLAPPLVVGVEITGAGRCGDQGAVWVGFNNVSDRSGSEEMSAQGKNEVARESFSIVFSAIYLLKYASQNSNQNIFNAGEPVSLKSRSANVRRKSLHSRSYAFWPQWRWT